jgi:hypothetical protein
LAPLALIVVLILSASAALAQSPCKINGDVDVFILQDVSGSMFDDKTVVPHCVGLIESKVGELSAGTINIVPFAEDWIQLRRDRPANFETRILAGESNAQQRILEYLQPMSVVRRPGQDLEWAGFYDAASKTFTRGTDIGRATDKALDILEARLNSPDYRTNTLGQQLWVLTDSAEGYTSHRLADILERMRLLRSRTWFEYHEIAFETPDSLNARELVRRRHEAITRAGFFVDYSRNLARTVRIPAPWPVASQGLLGNAQEFEVPCDDAQPEVDVKIQPAMVFEPCLDGGPGIVGRFDVTFNTIVPTAADLRIIWPGPVDQDSFGHPIESLRVRGDFGAIAPGSTLAAEFSMSYRFVPAPSMRADQFRVSYLAPQETKFWVKMTRRPQPFVTVRTIAPGSSSAGDAPPGQIQKVDASPGDDVSVIELRGTNLVSELSFVVAVENTFPGALHLGSQATSAEVKLGPGHESAQIHLYAAGSELCKATGILRITEVSPGSCRTKIEASAIPIEVQFATPVVEVVGIEPAVEAVKISGFQIQRADVNPGDRVGVIEVRAPNLSSDLTLEGSLISEPAGALLFDDHSANLTLKLGSGQERKQIRFFAASGSDSCSAKGTFGLRVVRKGVCSAPADILTLPLEIQYHKVGELHWFSRSGAALSGIPEGIRLRALHPVPGEPWRFESKNDEMGLAGAEFELTLPACLAGMGGCEVSLEGTGVNNIFLKAVALKWDGWAESSLTSSFISDRPGKTHVALSVLPQAGARLYRGVIKVKSAQGKFELNGKPEIKVPVTVDLVGFKNE